ncbi:MAG: inner membrane protein YbjM [Ewingella americana]|jgi:hypothetical protein|uniref:Inner membrane protein ybjM n=2 Tax=Ewingella americana TaxID=41202 RepID=A0A2N0MUJ0_9GAMM|nr:inner membrane protein YbjM [Ewingella americana]KAA8729576.1 hypothetical protein F4W05_05000 [Ewingella americana]KFC82567.1 putative inner membrane protein [Ewingella americana ATCC 33852]MCI1678696.1 inner membrane protein YbjM [Ewingella americana]MCI1854283.1 inner membrane protein YbjM [Ewingella americana]MCI1861583.1 inner membrane protein YbjM [Ewingella americana]
MHVRSSVGPIICCVLFTLIFVLLKTEVIVVRHITPGPEYGLLLFIFPGIITAHLVKRYALRYAFLGALLAIPVCYLLRILYFVRVRTFIQELAYAGSAIFWCVMGALFYLLIRAIVLHMTKE